VRKRNNVKRPT